MEGCVGHPMRLVSNELLNRLADVLALQEVPQAVLSLPELDAKLELGRPSLLEAELDVEDLLLVLNLVLPCQYMDVVVNIDGAGVVDSATLDHLGLDVDSSVADNGHVAEILADDSIVCLVSDVAGLRETVEHLLEMKDLALELALRVNKVIGNEREEVVNVELAV